MKTISTLQELPERSLKQLGQLQDVYIGSAQQPEQLALIFGA